MSLITIQYVFSAGQTIIASQHNANFSTIYNAVNGLLDTNNISPTAGILYSQLALGGNIVNADISAAAAITDTKLAQITTASKVSGTAITGLASLPSGAGVIPSANLPSSIPSGGIIMWSGSIATIPSGWVLCDGNNSTPDLRNRFIVGADADASGIAKSTVTGSPLQTSDGVIPSHTHAFGTGSGASSTNGVQAATSAATSGIITQPSGSGTKNIATFYALAFIMKS